MEGNGLFDFWVIFEDFWRIFEEFLTSLGNFEIFDRKISILSNFVRRTSTFQIEVLKMRF